MVKEANGAPPRSRCRTVTLQWCRVRTHPKSPQQPACNFLVYVGFQEPACAAVTRGAGSPSGPEVEHSDPRARKANLQAAGLERFPSLGAWLRRTPDVLGSSKRRGEAEWSPGWRGAGTRSATTAYDTEPDRARARHTAKPSSRPVSAFRCAVDIRPGPPVELASERALASTPSRHHVRPENSRPRPAPHRACAQRGLRVRYPREGGSRLDGGSASLCAQTGK